MNPKAITPIRPTHLGNYAQNDISDFFTTLLGCLVGEVNRLPPLGHQFLDETPQFTQFRFQRVDALSPLVQLLNRG